MILLAGKKRSGIFSVAIMVWWGRWGPGGAGLVQGEVCVDWRVIKYFWQHSCQLQSVAVTRGERGREREGESDNNLKSFILLELSWRCVVLFYVRLTSIILLYCYCLCPALPCLLSEQPILRDDEDNVLARGTNTIIAGQNIPTSCTFLFSPPAQCINLVHRGWLAIQPFLCKSGQRDLIISIQRWPGRHFSSFYVN